MVVNMIDEDGEHGHCPEAIHFGTVGFFCRGGSYGMIHRVNGWTGLWGHGTGSAEKFIWSQTQILGSPGQSGPQLSLGRIECEGP